MNTLKLKYITLSFLATLIIAVFMTSCEQESTISEVLEYQKEDVNYIQEHVCMQDCERTVKNANGITYEVINGEYVLGGDIILTQAQVDKIEGEGTIENRGAGLADLADRWDYNMVPFKISSSLPNQARVTNAIAHWEANSNLRFVPREDEDNYIEFVVGSGCSSSLGMIGGRQLIRLAAGCSTGNTIHEIGHAVGLMHEQTRLDRDNSVVINWNNIQNGFAAQFERYDQNNINGFDDGPFDFNSIMMYGSFAFSQNGQPTITTTTGGTFTGQRTALSVGDRNIINDDMYPDHSFVVMYEGDDVEQDVICGANVSAGINRIRFTAGGSPCTNDEVRSLRFINMRAGQTIALFDDSWPSGTFFDNGDDYIRIDILRNFDEATLGNLELDKIPGNVQINGNTWRVENVNFRATYQTGGNLDGKVSRFNSDN